MRSNYVVGGGVVAIDVVVVDVVIGGCRSDFSNWLILDFKFVCVSHIIHAIYYLQGFFSFRYNIVTISDFIS